MILWDLCLKWKIIVGKNSNSEEVQVEVLRDILLTYVGHLVLLWIM